MKFSVTFAVATGGGLAEEIVEKKVPEKKSVEAEPVAKKSADNPLFKEIVASQLAFAKRTTQWEQDTVVPRRMAFDHYWGPNGAAKKI